MTASIEFSALSPEKRRLLELLLEEEGISPSQAAIPRRRHAARAATSFAQQRLWFLDQLDPGSPQYNLPTALRLTGELDVRALERALGALVERHETLRTTFQADGSEPFQSIGPPRPVTVDVQDLRDLPAEDREPTALKRAADAARVPFDLGRGPLLRACLWRTAEREQIALLAMHHIVSDGWSAGILTRELAALYSAPQRAFPDLPIQYADFAEWQRQRLQGTARDAELEYWKKQLAGVPPLELPFDKPRPASPSNAGACHGFRIPFDTAARLRELARSEGATPFMLLLAAFRVLLFRYSGQTDFCIGTPIAGRSRPELEGLIGFFVNTLALRTPVAAGSGFRECLRATRETALAAYERQEIPFDTLVSELHPERSLSRAPLLQTMFSLETSPARPLAMPGLRIEPLDIDTGTALFDLTMTLADTDGGLEGWIRYSTELFEPPTIARLSTHFLTLLESILRDPERPVSRLDMLPAEERKQIVAGWNADRRQIEWTAVHTLFERQAAATPERAAVWADGRSLSYAELNRRANQLARVLRGLGVRPEVRVGLSLPRSCDMIVGLLGILKAGGAYVPLDPAYPADRLAYMLEDSGARVLVTKSGSLAQREGLRVVCLDLQEEELAAQPGSDFDGGAEARNLAYIIYTSGSTGKPKGVMIEHWTVVNLFEALDRTVYRPHTSGPSRVTLNAPLSFDASVQQLAALLRGDALYVVPEGVRLDGSEFVAFLRSHRIDVADCVPSQLKLLIESGLLENTAHQPAVFIPGGEPIDEKTWSVLASAKHTRFFNAYGPTECTVDSTLCRIWTAPGRPTIGGPITNAQFYVLDRYLEPVPAGVPGELFIGGWGVGRGYLNRPGLTAEKFVPDPFAAVPGARLYRTGDLVRWIEGGSLEFLGRIDRQVKVRGFRIELGEIEAALRADQGVKQVAVLARPDAHGQTRLSAYIVPEHPEQGRELLSSLRDRLKQSLPGYMSPSAYVLLESFPLLPNGKLDVNSLPNPDTAPHDERESYVPPGDPLEVVIAARCSELLGVPRPGMNHNFFELGGDSIKAAMLANRLQQEFGAEVRVRWIFEASTLGALAERLRSLADRPSGEERPTAIVPVPRGADLQPSSAQYRMWLLEQIESDRPVYNIPIAVRLRGALIAPVLEDSLNRVVARHEALRTAFPVVNGRPVQRIAAQASVGLPVIDLSGMPPESREAEARRVSLRDAEKRFDLTRPPLIRGCVLRFGDCDHVLVLTVHHIVFDGWSSRLLVEEISAIYGALVRGQIPALPPLATQYADYAEWQRRRRDEGALEAQILYWRNRLSPLPPALDLPADRARGAVQSAAGALCKFALPPALSEKIRAFGRERNLTTFMTLLAAYAAFLARYSGQDDIAIGTPVAGRGRPETERLIGLFVNTVVARVDAAGDPSFEALADRVRTTVVDALANQDVPFDRVVEAVEPDRNVTRSPLFQVMFTFASEPRGTTSAAGLGIETLDTASGAAAFDLTLGLSDAGGCIEGALEYSLDLFDASTAQRMAAHFGRLIESAMADPARPISALELRTEAETCLLAEWNPEPPAAGGCIHDLIEAQAARVPDAVAVRAGAGTLTYLELNRRANRLARLLRGAGVRPETRVAICLERSADLVVAALAVWKAGGCCVPVDPEYPAERIAFLLADCGAGVAIVQSSTAPLVGEFKGRTLSLDECGDALLLEADTDPEPVATADNLAYIIYTSGSTGQPKGVATPHRGLVNAWPAWRRTYRLDGGRRVLQMARFSFDVFTQDMVRALCAGGRLVLCPREYLLDPPRLFSFMRAEGIDFAEFVPAALRSFAAHLRQTGQKLDFLKVLVSGADRLNAADYVILRALCGDGTAILNSYGVTEATIDNACFESREPLDGGPQAVPIGRPFPGTNLYVADRNLHLAPVGVFGELCVAGSGLARGYLDRPGLTAERFVPNPFSAVPGSRMYRTGDRARYRPDGNLEFGGRLDHQVKVRGFRVEAGEIETALLRHPNVHEAAVVAREADDGNARLAAYVVAADGAVVEASELRAFLQRTLPDYMVPASFTLLESMPRTPSGKTDRRALPAPDGSKSGSAQAEPASAPANEIERLLARIWQEVLGRECVGTRENFFVLGGDSILCIQVIARANEAGLRLTPRQLFQNPTIEALAAVAGRAPESAADQGLLAGEVPLTPVQRWFFEQEFADPHHYNQSVLLQTESGLRRDVLEETFSRLLAHHDALRLRFSNRQGKWEQEYSDPCAGFRIGWHDLSGVSGDARPARIREICGGVQSSFDLTAGPLLAAAYIDLGPRAGGRLLVAIHHLAVDGVSWRILLEDFQRVYSALAGGHDATLPGKTASFRQWAQALHRYAGSGALLAQAQYWKTIAGKPVGSLPRDRDGGNTEASEAEVLVAIDADETRSLIEEAAPAAHVEIGDLLAAALWRALSMFTGAQSVVVDFEGHGREPIDDAVDVSRTVGWFTSVYPVLLEANRHEWPLNALKRIKQGLREVPDHGLGYGVLRYLAADGALAGDAQADVCFNYLGQFNDAAVGWKPAPEPQGPERSPRNRRSYAVEVNGGIAGGCLQLRWTYSSAMFYGPTIERLARTFVQALRDLVRACGAAKHQAATPADFPFARIDQHKLDRLIARAGARPASTAPAFRQERIYLPKDSDR